MADFNTFLPGDDDTAVPGFFSQSATTYGYELDFEKLREQSGTTGDAGDIVGIQIIPQGFCVLGASIETVIPDSLGATFSLLLNGHILIAPAAAGNAGDRRYNPDDGDIPFTLAPADDSLRDLNLVMITQPVDDGVFKISITGIYLHGRETRAIGQPVS